MTNWNKDGNKLTRNDYESEIKRMKRLLLSYMGLQAVRGPCLPDTHSEREKMRLFGFAD